MHEEWRPIRLYEGHYEASSAGRIRRSVGGRGATQGRVLRAKQPTRHSDYQRVQLCKRDVKRTHGVHVLVCEAFHGRRPRGKFPNHIDGNKLNNSAANLEWVTRRQNQRHAVANGLINYRPLRGEENGRARLSRSQVEEIKRQKGVIGQRVLAALCGVSKTCIQLIHQGKHWQ